MRALCGGVRRRSGARVGVPRFGCCCGCCGALERNSWESKAPTNAFCGAAGQPLLCLSVIPHPTRVSRFCEERWETKTPPFYRSTTNSPPASFAVANKTTTRIRAPVLTKDQGRHPPDKQSTRLIASESRVVWS